MQRSTYSELRPAATCAWVDAFWTVTSGGQAQRILPDGCIDFIFDLEHGSATAVGTMTASKLVTTAHGARRFGVRFRPGAAGALTEPAAWELTDRVVPLDDVCRSARAHGLAERMADARDDAERVRIFAGYLASGRASARARDARVLRAIEKLSGHGEQPIAALAAELGLSERQLERLFHAHVGTRPKLLARVLRMQRALTSLERDAGPQARPQAQHAHAARFADEAHLVREFRALTGLTPQGLLAERRVGFVQEPRTHA